MKLDDEIILKNEELIKNIPLKELRKASEELSFSYLQEKKSAALYINDKNKLYAYQIIRLPATFSVNYRVLSEILPIYEDEISNVLDIGSGSGASILALNKLINKKINIDALEIDKKMIEISSFYFSNKEIAKHINYIEKDFFSFENKKTYDLVILSYVFNEFKDHLSLSFIDKLLSLTNNFLVIIEPGKPKNFSELNAFKEIILKKGINIISPCPHNNTCPIKNTDYCAFQERILREKITLFLKNASLNYEDENYFYLIFSKKHQNEGKCRLLRHPIINKNNIKLFLCDKEKCFQKEIYKKEKELFKKAKKAKSGDTF